MKEKLKVNVAFPIVTAILAILWIVKGVFEYGLWDPSTTSPKDGLFPMIIAIVLLIASIGNIIGSRKEEKVTFSRNALYLMIAIAVIYIATDWIGLLPSLLIFYVLWLKIYAKESWKNTIIATIAVFAIVYFGFSVGLKIRFPMGKIFEMMM